jgi:hypothetical protein
VAADSSRPWERLAADTRIPHGGAGADSPAAGIKVTAAHLVAYKAYGGDIDRWLRTAKSAADPQIAQAWAVIDVLLLQAANLNAGNVSDAYAGQIRRTIADATESEEVAREFLRMA